MKKSILLLSVLAAAIGCNSTRYAENRALLKEYAYCECVRAASGDSLLAREISKSIYRDIAHYDLSAYETVDSFVQIKAAAILPSIIADHEGKKAVLLSCFQVYRSKSLDSLVKAMDKKVLQ